MFFFLRYPLHFIDTQFTRFFSDHLSFDSFLPMIENGIQYQLLHDSIRHKSITKPSKESGPNQSHQYKLPSSTSTATMMISNKSKQDRIIVHDIHEGRFRSFKKDIHRIHQEILKNPHALETRLIVGNRNRRSAQFQLIRKRPSKKLLKNMPLLGNLLISFITRTQVILSLIPISFLFF